jgi:hypothetical protein
MEAIFEKALDCPYCGETVTVIVDGSVLRQEYVEDCEVCCKPMVIVVEIGDDGSPAVSARDENEA